MDFFYFLVTGSNHWEPHYHQNFFVTQGAFTIGVVYALILGIVFALAFYFGCCNSKVSMKSASFPIWVTFMLLAGVASYLVADMHVIGLANEKNQKSLFYNASFYKANEEYYIEKTRNIQNEQLVKDLMRKKTEIKSKLDKGGDVRFEYSLTTALLSCIFFYVFSILVKQRTINGKSIPHKFPMKS